MRLHATVRRIAELLISALALLAMALLFARPAGAQVFFVADLAGVGCVDGSPRIVMVIDGADATDCATGLGTIDVVCVCLDGAWVGLPTTGGAGGGYATCQEEGVSLTQRSTLNFVGASITCADAGGKTVCTLTDATGPSITLDLGDDGGNDSTALAEIAPTNDNGGAFTEPSADKLQIDVAKLRPASFSNPRESPHAYDCEFTSGICADWAWTAGAGSSAPAAGTIDPTASVSGDPVLDCSSWPGRCLVQSDESTAVVLGLARAVTLDTNATIFASTTVPLAIATNTYANNEASSCVKLRPSGDADDYVIGCVSETDGTDGATAQFSLLNAGSATNFNANIPANGSAPNVVAIAIYKSTNTYYGFAFTASGSYYYLGSATKTGTTTLDEVVLEVFTANNTPSIIYSFDFFRYYSSKTFALMNE